MLYIPKLNHPQYINNVIYNYINSYCYILYVVYQIKYMNTYLLYIIILYHIIIV